MDAVLHINTPGLGDHLQYSTLPEEYSKVSKDFYLHKQCNYRNREIYELVWGMNPYVKGITDQTPTAGEEIHCKNKLTPRHKNYISLVEARNGILTDNKYPKIYYKYDRYNNKDFKNKVFIDNNLVSYKTNCQNLGASFAEKVDNNFKNKVNELIESYYGLEINLIRFKNFSFNNFSVKNKNVKVYEVENIFEYCELIKNCHTLVCCFTGSAVLASAIKQNNLYPKVKVLIHGPHLEDCIKDNYYIFDNNEYISL